jgi:hypothetical protein
LKFEITANQNPGSVIDYVIEGYIRRRFFIVQKHGVLKYYQAVTVSLTPHQTKEIFPPPELIM